MGVLLFVDVPKLDSRDGPFPFHIPLDWNFSEDSILNNNRFVFLPLLNDTGGTLRWRSSRSGSERKVVGIPVYIHMDSWPVCLTDHSLAQIGLTDLPQESPLHLANPSWLDDPFGSQLSITYPNKKNLRKTIYGMGNRIDVEAEEYT